MAMDPKAFGRLKGEPSASAVLGAEHAPRIFDENVIDRPLIHPVSPQTRDKMLENVTVAEAAVAALS
jgi:hypothetical protein